MSEKKTLPEMPEPYIKTTEYENGFGFEIDLLEYARLQVDKRLRESTEAAFEIALGEIGYYKKHTCFLIDTTCISNNDIYTTAECSVCGTDFYIDFKHANFCPCCGARVLRKVKRDD